MAMLIKYWWDREKSSMGKLMVRLAYIAVVASVALNVALLQRLQSISVNDLSYVLDPKTGMVWQLDTHSEFVRWLTRDSLLPYWAQAPIRVEKIDSLVLVGHLTPITDKCDWRRIERYRKLQRTCFRYYDPTDTEATTMVFEKAAEISPESVDHPVVSLMAMRLAESGRKDDSPALLVPIVMSIFEVSPRWKHSQSEPKAAILFRGWAARNFEIVTAMVPPSPNDYSER